MKLKDICEINPRTQGIDDNTEVSFVPMPSVSEDGKIDTSDIRIYQDVKKGYTVFQENDVLFAKITPCMENRKGAVARGLMNGIGCGSSEFHVLRPNKEIATSEWIYYLTAWGWFRKEAEKHMTGSAGQRRVPKAYLENYVINIPSLSEQAKQVKVLSWLQQIIDDRKKELKYLDELIKARFVEMFGNPVLNDKGWEQRALGDITTKIGSGATPKGGKGAYQEEGITLIRSMNVHNGQFEYKDLAHISDEQAARLDNVTIEENDVLLNITGASVARSCVVPTEVLPARVNQHVCIIRCKECIIPEFLNKLLIDDNYQDLLWSIAGSGATREAITKQQVEGLQIIVPPIEQQKEFMVFCKQIDKSKVVVQAALDKAQLLFDSLMQEYFG